MKSYKFKIHGTQYEVEINDFEGDIANIEADYNGGGLFGPSDIRDQNSTLSLDASALLTIGDINLVAGAIYKNGSDKTAGPVLFNAYNIIIERIKNDRELWGASIDEVTKSKDPEYQKQIAQQAKEAGDKNFGMPQEGIVDPQIHPVTSADRGK